MAEYGKRPLWQWILIYLIVGGLLYGAVYYFYIAKKGGYSTGSSNNGYNYTNNTPAAPSETAMPASGTPGATKSITVTMNAENNSGESGTATLTEENGKTTVVVQVTGYPSNPQPEHIHVGACPGVGAVKYPLSNLVNGSSTTVLNVTLDQLKSELPLALNIHQSAKAITDYTSCGVLSIP